MKVTNNGKSKRILPLLNGEYVEIDKGATVEFPDKDWNAIKDRQSVAANLEDGTLKADGAKAEPKKTKAELEAEAKAKADADAKAKADADAKAKADAAGK